jgi:hypothetical protein
MSYFISYMISYHLSNALILGAAVMVQEVSMRLLNISTYFCCVPDMMHPVSPVQLIPWILAGGTGHCRAESCCSNLQTIHYSMLMMCPVQVGLACLPSSRISCFCKFVDLCKYWIHGPHQLLDPSANNAPSTRDPFLCQSHTRYRLHWSTV